MPLFVPKRDMQFVRNNHAELHRLAFAPIRLHKRNRAVGSYDPLYKEERVEDYLSGEVYDIPAFVRIQPQQAELTRFGIAEKRDIRVQFSTEVLQDGFLPPGEPKAIPFPWPEVGDFVLLQGELYVLTDIRPMDYFGNASDTPMTLEAAGLKVKPLSNPGKPPEVKASDSAMPTKSAYRDIYGE